MNSDRPVSTQEEDHFNRWNLAKGVAKELAMGREHGICIGVYGPWGAGKTSFLKFVEAHLKEMKQRDVIWQNGWLGHSWEIYAQLLFQEIFDVFDEDIASTGQRAAETFKEWINLAAVKLKIASPGNIFSAEVNTSGVKGFLHQVAQIDLVKLREALKQKEEHGPIIVFVDDIDRQETQEIRELFRLLRFFSELPSLNFLVAMDPQIVAPALQEAYHVDGLQVLDKFIQLPLKLPVPKSDRLLQLFDRVLETAFDSFEDYELEHLRRGVYSLILKVIKTPRQIHVLGNTLRMSIHVLADEVNKADLIFISCLGITAPDLVRRIFECRELLLGTNLSFLLFESPGEQAYSAICRIFDKKWGDLEGREVLEILQLLFPQIKGLFYQPPRQSQYSHHEVGPRHHKRLCHDDYFHRYFEFCISDYEVKEREIDFFIEKLNKSELKEDAYPEFFRLLQLDSFRFILGLESRSKKIADIEKRKTLAILLAVSAQTMSTDNVKHHFFPGGASPWAAAADLVPKLFFSNKPFCKKDLLTLIHASEPVTFAFEWMHDARKYLDDDKTFWNWFYAGIANKIEQDNKDNDIPIFLRYQSGKRVFLLDCWIRGAGAIAVQNDMYKWLEKAPEIFVDFLLLYVTHSVVIVGKPRQADDLEHADFLRLRQFLSSESILLCLKWLNQESEWLQNLEKFKQTLLFQFCEKLVAESSMVWSKSSKSGLFHIETCSKAKRIKDENRIKGSPPSGFQAHDCVEEDKSQWQDDAQSIVDKLAKIPDIRRQD